MRKLVYMLFVMVLSCGSVTADVSFPEVPYGTGQWTHKLGNHRILVEVPPELASAKAVTVTIPWRRSDDEPESKDVVIRDAQGNVIAQKSIIQANNEKGIIAFAPTAGAGTYYLYHFSIDKAPKLPMLTYFPITIYSEPKNTEDTGWLNRYIDNNKWQSLPSAKVTKIEARSEFHSFYPMEVIATEDEVSKLISTGKNSQFLLFPEDRKNPIRMKERLPQIWVTRDQDKFAGQALQNEYYAFQIGVYAISDIPRLGVEWTDLVASDGSRITKDNITCFNVEGTDTMGKRFTKDVHVAETMIQPLWFGVDIAEDQKPQIYKGSVTINDSDGTKQSVAVEVSVKNEAIADRGDSEVWRHSRLRWLNSDIGLNDDVVSPFTKMEYANKTISILGREIQLADTGLPQSVKSFIDMSDINTNGREVLASPIRFIIETQEGITSLTPKGVKKIYQADGLIRFVAYSENDDVKVKAELTAEMDGCMRYRLTTTAKREINIKDARLEMPFKEDVAKYLKMKSEPARFAPDSYETTMKVGLYVNGFWLGDYNAGIAFKPKNSVDQLNTNRRTRDRTPLPDQWVKSDNGNFVLNKTGNAALMKITSGPRQLSANDTFDLNFSLYITPFKPIAKEHWDYRYYHQRCGWSPKMDKAKDAKIINLHSASKVNPWINYPFLTDDEFKEVIEIAHSRKQRVKIYNTIREQSVRTGELWALRSLGDEIVHDGEGYRELSKKPMSAQKHWLVRTGQPWLAEHLISNYQARWHNPIEGSHETVDASFGVQGISRWQNYYLEGLDYLSKNVGIDGLYLDGIGYDRRVMKRVRKSLLNSKPTNLIDFHETPFPNLQHLPYIDSIWFGEGANYSLSHPYWLVEVSGIPFGLTGEILKPDAGNHRGMVYGIWKRDVWSGNPKPLWKWFDRVKIEDHKFLGYWHPECPVATSEKDIKATAFVNKSKSAIIAIASWAGAEKAVELDIDWAKLGLDKDRVRVSIPWITGYQRGESIVDLDSPIAIKPGKGVLIQIEDPKKVTNSELIVVSDEVDAKSTGEWTPGKSAPILGFAYSHDGNKEKGSKSMLFDLAVPESGRYRVKLLYPEAPNRASNTPVTVSIGDHSETFRVNQRESDGEGCLLGSVDIPKHVKILVSNAATDGYVVVDGVQAVKEES